MEQMGLTRSDLIDIIGSRARVSEVLNRKRPLTVAMIVRLREELGTGNPLSVPVHRNRAMIAPMKSIQSSIRVDPEILSGTPVFDGTRVPVQTLMDYLKVGDRVDDFLDDFPTVSREQIAAVLDVAGEAVTRYARTA
jgi:uncharacterized protein (DUF433 family)